MGKKTTSKTEEQIDGLPFLPGSPYKTTISDGDKSVEGYGNTSKESQKDASDKWDKAKDSGSDSSGSSGICFLTTACAESKGLPDDCHELSALRYFRDSYIAKLPDGQQLISEYYKIAPAIVGAINRLPDSRNIYNQIYDQLVLRSVKLINSGKLAEALSNYLHEVTELKQKFS